MIEEQGQVVAVQENVVWVQTFRASACQSCKLHSGCGQRMMTELGSADARQIRVANTVSAQLGDQVRLGISESALLYASILVYLFPLLGLIAGAILASQALGLDDAGTALAGVTGMGLTFFMVRVYQTQANTEDFSPVLLEVLCMSPDLGTGRSSGTRAVIENFRNLERYDKE